MPTVTISGVTFYIGKLGTVQLLNMVMTIRTHIPIFLLLLVFIPSALSAAGVGRVAVYPGNHHYLQDADGNPLLLIGFGNEILSGASTLDKLKNGVTYTRSYPAVFIRQYGWNDNYEHQPWEVVNGKVDMNAWNDAYWTNFRNNIKAAQDRNIIVTLTIWDGHTQLPTGKAGDISFWKASNNVQGVQFEYDLNALNSYPNPSKNGGTAERMAYYQRRYVDKVLSEVSNFSNVIIELNNEEARGSSEWWWQWWARDVSEGWWLWWARYVHDKGYVVAVNDADSGGAISDSTFKSTPYVDMKSYHVRTDSSMTSARYNFGKVIVADADNSCGDLNENQARRIAWKSVLRGGGWNDFVCSSESFPNTSKIAYYSHLLDFFSSNNVPFWEMSPKGNLSSSGYAFVKTGEQYVVYAEQNVEVDFSGTSETLQYMWYDPRTGATVELGTISGGAKRSFNIPASDDYILWITADNTPPDVTLPSPTTDVDDI
jgi:hypothetical protein